MVRFRNLLSLVRRRRPVLKFVYSDRYWMVDIGRHVFPARKYRLIYEHLLRKGVKKDRLLTPKFASDEDIELVHTAKYLRKLTTGKLSHSELQALELPFSREIFDFFLLTVGGTILAAEQALTDGLTVHIGGGFHHAFPDHGEGFCLLNDVAVALEKMKKEGHIERAMVIDCDVHQGNGTAVIFEDKDYAFTFSIHQMDLYPARKTESSLDVELWSGAGDQKYLEALQAHIPVIYREFRPHLVFYLAGADAYQRDQLGGLDLTMEGLIERDRIVIGEARALDIPLVVLFAGGYAFDVDDTVAIHLNTIKTAQKMLRAL